MAQSIAADLDQFEAALTAVEKHVADLTSQLAAAQANEVDPLEVQRFTALVARAVAIVPAPAPSPSPAPAAS